MTAVQVGTLGAALGVIDKLRDRLADFRPLWDRIEKRVLPEAQKRAFDDFGPVALATSRQRARSKGYYRHQPSVDARPSGPKFRWTGALQKSTATITERGPLFARIDPDRNYSGPILGGQVFSKIVGSRVAEPRIWNQAYIERGIERELEKWVADLVGAL